MANKLTKNIVCLGGGVGTSNVLSGLRSSPHSITVITSMADDGGSSGKLRKGYGIMPPGDIINCIAALIPNDNRELAALLLHRFPGENKSNKAIDGQKLGNLIMLAEIQRTGDFYKAIAVTKKIFGVHAELLPATDERVTLSAVTKDGRRVHSETTLDLALYSEPHGLDHIYITPSKPLVNDKVVQALHEADVIISGPGDLYTNQLPVLVVPQIRDAVLQSKAEKIFILNTANKPFETKNYSVDDFIAAVIHHLGSFPFDSIFINTNMDIQIPHEYPYTYVTLSPQSEYKDRFVLEDLVSEEFPLYHDPLKLANLLQKHI